MTTRRHKPAAAQVKPSKALSAKSRAAKKAARRKPLRRQLDLFADSRAKD